MTAYLLALSIVVVFAFALFLCRGLLRRHPLRYVSIRRYALALVSIDCAMMAYLEHRPVLVVLSFLFMLWSAKAFRASNATAS